MTSSYEFKRFITSQQVVTNEIIKLIGLYEMGELDGESFEENITKYVHYYKDFLTEKSDKNLFILKGTPQIKLGKKRIRVIASCLESQNIAKLVDLDNAIFKVI